jgi:hypothetical protein
MAAYFLPICAATLLAAHCPASHCCLWIPDAVCQGVVVAAAWAASAAFVLSWQVVDQFGHSRRWSEIAKHIPGRSGKQCRERYVNHME